MPKPRPSYVSIRARQRNIIEGLGTTDLRYAQAAKRFGVTPRELKTFVETKPRKLRSNFNRSPVYRKLYTEGARPQVREQLGVKRIRRFKFMPKEIHDIETSVLLSQEEINRRTQTGQMIRNLYARVEQPKILWAVYAREHNLPTSIKVLAFLHRNNKISDDTYLDAIESWRDIYNISSSQYAVYSSSLPEEYDVA